MPPGGSGPASGNVHGLPHNPLIDIGRSDLMPGGFPSPVGGRGFGPEGSGGSLMGPRHPGFPGGGGIGPFGGDVGGGGGLGGGLGGMAGGMPGARFDPYGPPGVGGFPGPTGGFPGLGGGVGGMGGPFGGGMRRQGWNDVRPPTGDDMFM
jgi:hypothetical protein